MINSKIKLVILVMDEQTFKYSVLSASDPVLELPSIEISEYMDIDAAIQLLMSNYLNTSIQDMRYPYKFSDIYVSDSLDLYFFTIVNYTPNNLTGYKIPINKYECHLPNLGKVLQRLQS